MGCEGMAWEGMAWEGDRGRKKDYPQILTFGENKYQQRLVLVVQKGLNINQDTSH